MWALPSPDLTCTIGLTEVTSTPGTAPSTTPLQPAAESEEVGPLGRNDPAAERRAEILLRVVGPPAPVDCLGARIVIAARPLPDIAGQIVQAPLGVALRMAAHRARGFPVALAEIVSLAIPARPRAGSSLPQG